MPYADLHVHTTRSDGSLEPEAVPAAARSAGVAVVAVTDHDVLPPFDEPIVERDGVTIVSGIELRVEPDGGERVDLLGYGVRRTASLEREVERIQRDRIDRGQAIVDCVEDRLDIDLGVDVSQGFGRPHVARAIDAHPGTDIDYEGAFDELIGSGGPCYRQRAVPTFEEGRRLLAECCALVSLAHPLRYREPAAALERARVLDAVEREYPYGRDVDCTPVDRTIADHDLLATGGSDAHDTAIGAAGLDRESYDRLALDR